MKKQTTKTEKTSSDIQKLSGIRGRAMLEWYGKRAPKSIEYFPAQEKEVYGDLKAKDWNKIFWGDNKQVLAHLLKEYRGKVDLIYIDPPFDSNADYVKKVKLRGQQVQGVDQNAIEQMQYADIWENDEYLQFIYERLIIMRELLSDKGSFYLHCDHHKGHYLKIVLDEVFGSENFQNEIVWRKGSFFGPSGNLSQFPNVHDVIFFYTKNKERFFELPRESYQESTLKQYKYKDKKGTYRLQELRDYTKESIEQFRKDGKIEDTAGGPKLKQYLEDKDGKVVETVWSDINRKSDIIYPTEKPEALLERIIKASSKEGDLVMDCFMGSGTTLAVAQKLKRRWIGCDINKGAIITATERLNKIIKEQGGKSSFKVYNVNHYDVFNNDIQARQLLIETYKIEELSRGDFDGTLGADYVKIVSPNRVLSKTDILQVIDAIKKNKDLFIAKTMSKQKDATFENKVVMICSGAELDARDFVKRENNTGVEIEIRDIQVDKKDLNFKKPTEASVTYTTKGNVLTIDVKDYYSPLLMKRLELENEGRLSMKDRVNVFDYRQAIEHIVIDVNYGEGQNKSKDIAFNAEAFMHKEKKNELVDVTYTHTYEKKGTYTIAIKIVDVLGEEYFETKEVTIK